MARYDRKDRFHQRAKREGYRSRAAYKLMELARGQRLLRRGDRVVDLGCWPGVPSISLQIFSRYESAPANRTSILPSNVAYFCLRPRPHF